MTDVYTKIENRLLFCSKRFCVRCTINMNNEVMAKSFLKKFAERHMSNISMQFVSICNDPGLKET